MLALGRIIWSHRVFYYWYTVDLQLYVLLTPDDLSPLVYLGSFIIHIKDWISENLLLFNDNKTKILVAGPSKQSHIIHSHWDTLVSLCATSLITWKTGCILSWRGSLSLTVTGFRSLVMENGPTNRGANFLFSTWTWRSEVDNHTSCPHR